MLVHEYGTCEEALRAFIGQDGWEQTMERISGTVTYASGEGADADQPVVDPAPTVRSSKRGAVLLRRETPLSLLASLGFLEPLWPPWGCLLAFA